MQPWLQIVLALGGSAIISSVFGFLCTRYLTQIFKQKDLEQQAEKEKEDKDRKDLEAFRCQQDREARLEDMKEILEPVIKDVSEIKQKVDKVAEGTLCTLRNDITSCYYRCRDKGYRNDYDYQNIHNMYKAYSELGGNSYITDIMKRFENLQEKENVVQEEENKTN